MTKKQVTELIVALKKSERSKVACGKRLVAYYEKIKRDLR